MSHLGERMSALVDGELGHAERERALSHLAVCESCRFEAEMLRRLKRRLSGLGAPEPSMDFMGRLAGLSADDRTPPDDDTPDSPFGPPPMPSRGFLEGLARRTADPAGEVAPRSGFGSMPPLGSSRPIGGGLPRRGGPDDDGTLFGGGTALATLPADDRPDQPAEESPRPARRAAEGMGGLARLRPGWGRTRFAVAGASVVALTLGTAFVVGGQQRDTRPVTPALSEFAVEHALTARQATLPDPAAVTAVDVVRAPRTGGEHGGLGAVPASADGSGSGETAGRR
ncbi:zf-HC2 domain-containing protein [Marinactinospora rubrisoli]|uniref:Zf-HC2 domain-containing protein n=1 Tax=Marinactinospora rubrisoli TaxID=2715399 RepID=A0ABW2KEF3_9ACTN